MLSSNQPRPPVLDAIERDTKAIGFTMASEFETGALLRTLAASKPAGAFLELGTGTGLSTAWLLDGMDSKSSLITVDSGEQFVAVAQRHLGSDPRVKFHVEDGVAFLARLHGQRFDLIFADTWPGKFDHLDDALALLKAGGLYLIDDLLPQPNWPDGHGPKVANLIATLEQRGDLLVTKLDWSSGMIIAARR